MAKYKKRLGDRRDGRKIRTLPPMMYVSPCIMKTRNGAQNLFSGKIDLEPIEEYLKAKKSDPQFKRLGFFHILLAAYVRTVSERPGINRFIAGSRIFARNEIVICMTVKKGLTLESQDTDMKLHLKPDATLFDIYDAANKTIDNAVAEGDTNEMDSVSRALVKLPVFLLRGFVNLMSAMDFLGIMPKAIEEASPFHCGLYVTNLGSLGIAPVYHHLFNFGTCPLFLAFGAKRREYKVCEDGSVKTMKYIDYTCTTDERIVDGHYYASAFKIFESYMKHPEKLELPPETVTEDIE